MTKGEKNKDISDISTWGEKQKIYECTNISEKDNKGRELDIGGEIW